MNINFEHDKLKKMLNSSEAVVLVNLNQPRKSENNSNIGFNVNKHVCEFNFI